MRAKKSVWAKIFVTNADMTHIAREMAVAIKYFAHIVVILQVISKSANRTILNCLAHDSNIIHCKMIKFGPRPTIGDNL